jgi:circadian clock protein KaiC
VGATLDGDDDLLPAQREAVTHLNGPLLVTGPAGSGKSTFAAQYVLAASRRGEQVAYFAFDESLSTMLARCKGLGMDLQEHLDAGRITVQQVDPGELSPGEFIHQVRREVETRKCRIVVIDSLNGYLNAMPNERFLMIQLHELLTYLGQQGVLTFLVLGQLGLVATAPEVPLETSYLADNVILFHYFEALGEVRQAMSVLKKRGGPHERSVRELKLGSQGICVGRPLREFQGVLTSVPRFVGEASEMLQSNKTNEAGGR